MLLALGLGSQIGLLEGMLCVIFDIDLFKRIKKQYMTGERDLSMKRCQKITEKNISVLIELFTNCRSCLRHMLFRGTHLLYWCWRVLAEDVRQLCRHYWSRHNRPDGNDLRDLRVRPRKVS